MLCLCVYWFQWWMLNTLKLKVNNIHVVKRWWSKVFHHSKDINKMLKSHQVDNWSADRINWTHCYACCLTTTHRNSNYKFYRIIAFQREMSLVGAEHAIWLTIMLMCNIELFYSMYSISLRINNSNIVYLKMYKYMEC